MRSTFIAGAIGLLALVPLDRTTRRLPPLPEAQGLAPDALSADIHRNLSVGYCAVWADWYWIEAIQYFGTSQNAHERYRRLGGYLRAASDLDPDFDYLYQFAGVALPYHAHDTGLWYNIGDTISLLRKGAGLGARRWEIPFLLGYLLYTFRGAYHEAGAFMEQSAKLPRSPAYLGTLALRLLAEGGSTGLAIALTQTALAQSQDARTRSDLSGRLKALYLDDDLRRLNYAADARKAAGQPIRAITDLVGFGGLAMLPDEPFGGRFLIDDGTGKVISTDDDRLLRVFVHPGASSVERAAD